MRRLNRKKALNLMKELDAFPKVPESYVETSASRGTVSIIVFTTMALLTIMEFFVYQNTWMKYEYEVDKDFTSKLRMNIDITVAMKCQYIGADVLDLAETMITSADGLIYEPVIFDLTPQQKHWHREDNSLQPRNACRIHGHLYVNKVAGNFHITVGKAIPHPRGHAHLAALVSHDSYNFSHRIDHFSFGELLPGLINPLDGTEKIASDPNHMFQYFITIVPTRLNTYQISSDTHQFSVTERERVINHASGSHGVSGIFMKYDISSLMVTVTEVHMPFWKFLVRLCGIIGGIFSTTGMLHGIGEFIVDVFCCRFKLGAYKPAPVSLHDGHANNHLPLITDKSTL
ncbi:endoplasmic reticulum-Golgi intermediate compartment protein 2 [Microcaecilia unicolor]|uniref:Endoplasmic reticulum-Golgi intermediate compartment protein n=1 Tax=Microcaecilia unicolor TaxID=1415580 RepID=A0A6P7YZW1_9AMPH|nr:endoplasmic reticulum-Golgi intermediate compartment protein 2 [Microcaecilia unicolor]XP_030070497.1 endoplasmic reticulum-Golgi intermediate compartment protein 2 [Microcaecilia unicolor]XP_030070498.1 endoplasmic reticulum-Golgi intermediate compartment protein 2 [Microcaecilia unicolor]XP_030070499.1 endoplasmic reticulum-Golgi intermediate compartment protein 2 [Microcaecilia unicolor]XP_030070500.1 endoplasmic reticulum-Golgi intermediate compartment protein 2 [Microcaecilia unicolor]